MESDTTFMNFLSAEHIMCLSKLELTKTHTVTHMSVLSDILCTLSWQLAPGPRKPIMHTRFGQENQPFQSFKTGLKKILGIMSSY